MPPTNPTVPVRDVFAAVVLEHKAVDDGEVDVRIVARDDTHDGSLSEADTDHEVVPALGKRTHGGLDGVRRARLYIPEHDS